MYPKVAGDIPIYPLFLVAAAMVGATTAWIGARRDGFANARFLQGLAILLVAAVGGAKLYSLGLRDWQLRSLVAELSGGFRWPGGIAALVLALPLVSRRVIGVATGRVADAVAPAIGFGVATSRIGCFLAGCCSGHLCQLPWGIRFPKGSPTWRAHVESGLIDAGSVQSAAIHPLQVYLGLWSVAVALFVMWYLPRRAFAGQLFLLFVALAGGGKFLLEFLRYHHLPAVQAGSLLLALMATTALAVKQAQSVEA